MKLKQIICVLLLFLNSFSNAQNKKKSITLPVGIYTVSYADFHSQYFGAGYEYQPVAFLGFELSGFLGRFSHDNYRLDGFMDEIQSSYMLYDGSFGGIKLSNRGYLFFNDKKRIALFAEYYLGEYLISADAKGQYKEQELTGNYSTGFKFYHGIAVGARLALTKKIEASVSIGENSIGFTKVLKNMRFKESPSTSVPHTSLDFIVFQFELMIPIQ
jgi:hypothetical protein